MHNGFGLFYFREDLTGPEFAQRFIEKASDVGVNLELETMVLRVTPERMIRGCNKKGMFEIQAKAVVLAMGCRERTREALMIPGTRPAGIFTAGTAQRYVNVEGFIPGREIVILGSGDVGMIMARRLTLEGAEVKAVVEALPYVGGLIRNEVQCLADFDIPILLGHTVTEIFGSQRVEGVAVAKADGDFNQVPGTQRTIPCDTLLVSVGLIPENELSRAAGVRLNPLTGGPFVDESRETNIPGIFAAGNVTHVHDLVDNVVGEGELAGVGAAEFATGKGKIGRPIELKPGKNIRYVVPQKVTGEKDVVLYMRVKEPAERVSVTVGGILRKSFRFVKPSEMVQIEVPAEEWSRIDPQTCELEVRCEARRAKT
jgi:thioredoxin reductase